MSAESNALERLALVDQMLAEFEQDPEPREWYAEAYKHKAEALIELGRYPEAITACQTLRQTFGDDTEVEVRRHVVEGIGIEGGAHEFLDENGDALACYEELMAIGASDPDVEIRCYGAHAAHARLRVLREQGRKPEERLAACDELIERYTGEAAPECQEWVTRAFVAKAKILQELHRLQEALDLYDLAMSRDSSRSDEPANFRHAFAMFSKIGALDKRADTERIVAIDDLIRAHAADDDPEVQDLVDSVRQLRSVLLEYAPKSRDEMLSVIARPRDIKIFETHQTMIPIGSEHIDMDNSRNDGSVTRRIRVSREHATEYAVNFEQVFSSGGTISLGPAGSLLGVRANAEVQLTKKYSRSQSHQTKLSREEEIEVSQPGRSRLRLTVYWKVIVQEGFIQYNGLIGPSARLVTVEVPFVAPLGLTFDQSVANR